MYKISLFLFLFLWSFANFSHAKTLYLFGGVGISDYNIATKDKTEINNKLTSLGFGSAKTNTDTQNLSHKFGVGVKIPLLLSIETSYENLGKISFNTTTTTPSETLTGKAEIRGVSIDLLKGLGPLAVSGGFLRITDTIQITSSKGDVDVPIDKILIPKIGVKLKYQNYRLEYNRVFITPNSHVNSIMLSYIFELF